MTPDQPRRTAPPSFAPGARVDRPADEAEPVVVGQQPDATRVLPTTPPRTPSSRPAAPRATPPRGAASV
ncbi:DUF2330 domain-containing protein, partial [Cellulomonas rhizosphaerae]